MDPRRSRTGWYRGRLAARHGPAPVPSWRSPGSLPAPVVVRRSPGSLPASPLTGPLGTGSLFTGPAGSGGRRGTLLPIA